MLFRRASKEPRTRLHPLICFASCGRSAHARVTAVVVAWVFPGEVSYVAAWIAVAAVRMHEILTASSRLQLYDMITRMAPVRT